MQSRTILLAIAIFASLASYAQGTVRGTVFDNFGAPFIGANIYQKDNPSAGTSTDLDGNYSLDIKTSDPVVLVYSAMGLENEEITVQLFGGQVLSKDVILKPKTVILEQVAEVVEYQERGGETAKKLERINSGVTMDYITSETMGLRGDSKVDDALQRVPAVSTVGGFMSVRGLADRYIKTTVNGSKIPTLDPFTNNIKLDIFPTGLIDNLVITKTASPDLPGDWSGAFLSIVTKDYPRELTIEFSTNVGYNTQTTFQEILTSQGSDTDWLGYDNGFRDIPDGVPITQGEFPIPVDPSYYQQFELLGITDALNGYGITENTNIEEGNAFHQVALMELGLLGGAQYNNEAAINEAIENYDNQYPDSYFFPQFNSELESIGQSFENTWFTTTKTAPMNFSQSLSIGNRTKLFGRELGFIIGGRYGNSVRYDGNSVLTRSNLPPEAGEDVPLANLDSLRQQVSQETAGWSALAQLSYKLNEFNSISLMVMPNFRGQNRARKYEGKVEDIFEVSLGDDQLYEERQQILYQMKTEHYLPGSKTKMEVHASLQQFRQIPDVQKESTDIQHRSTLSTTNRWIETIEMPPKGSYKNQAN